MLICIIANSAYARNKNIKDDLFSAIESNNIENGRIVISRGADVSTIANDGYTSLEIAARN